MLIIIIEHIYPEIYIECEWIRCWESNGPVTYTPQALKHCICHINDMIHFVCGSQSMNNIIGRALKLKAFLCLFAFARMIWS